jgi:hypothetical protein
VKQLLDWTARESCAVVRLRVNAMHGAARNESQRWVEVATDPLVGQVHVPEVVGIVDLESVRGCILPQFGTIRRERPYTGEKVFASE